MTLPPLDHRPFDPNDLSPLEGFSCGEKESYEKYLNEWIKGSEALESLDRGTQVILYFSGDSLVGYGSIGTSRLCWPYPKGKKNLVAIIPAFALSIQFHRKPEGVVREDRFSWRILEDLVARSISFGTDLLTLYVHRANQKGQKLYTNFGFKMIGESHVDDHFLMAYDLRGNKPTPNIQGGPPSTS